MGTNLDDFVLEGVSRIPAKIIGTPVKVKRKPNKILIGMVNEMASISGPYNTVLGCSFATGFTGAGNARSGIPVYSESNPNSNGFKSKHD